MKCVYAEQLGVELPERLTLCDIGCYDLEKQGIDGYYTGIGFRHSKGVSLRNMNSKMVAFMEDTIIPTMMAMYNVTREQIHVNDFTKLMDSYRVYVEV